MINNYFKKALSFFLTIASLITLSACQPTPENTPITNKTNGLTQQIQTTAEKTEQASVESNWVFKKEYNDGKQLNVNATIVNNQIGGAPVISLEKDSFRGNAELIKKIVNEFCGKDFDVRESVGAVTKEQRLRSILTWQNELKRAEEKGYVEGIEECQKALDKLMKEYQKAPSFSDLPQADFELKEVYTGSYQTCIIAQNNQNTFEIDFIDWTESIGSTMIIEDPSVEFPYDQEFVQCLSPNCFENDEVYKNGKERIDLFLKHIGKDYLQLNVVTKSKESATYIYYYTREINGFKETYNNAFFGSTQSNEEIVKDLWTAESLQVIVMDGEIIKMNWNNPSQIIEIDNENTKIIPFENAKEIFLKQIDFMLAPNLDDEIGKANFDFFKSNTAINITKVELGLTKLLMKDSDDSYKLIPTWNFYGYESGSGQEFDPNRGAEICYVTVNALDCSVVNHKAMN